MTAFERIITSKQTQALLIIIVVVIILFATWKQVEKLLGKSDSTSREYGRMINNNNLSISEAQAKAMADRLHEAMSGGGTDENEIYSVLRQLNTPDDWYLLNKVYGVRESKAWYSWYKGNLQSWFTNELSSSEKEEVRKILNGINVNY